MYCAQVFSLVENLVFIIYLHFLLALNHNIGAYKYMAAAAKNNII